MRTPWSGSDRAPAWVQGRLAELVAGELIEARSTGNPGATGTGKLFAFRHVLIRDATYATLTGDDRALGHRLAAEWLETRAAEPAVLAEHFARGDQPERALVWFQRGAEEAVDGGDLTSAADLASRGLALGAAGETAGALHLVLSEAHNWQREPDQAIAEAERALTLLLPGTRRWFKAADELFMALGKQRLLDRARAILLEAFALAPVDRRANSAKISFLARAAITMMRFGSPEMARLAVKRLDVLAGDPRELEPLVAARLHAVHALRARAEGDAAACLAAHEAGRACLEEIADFRTLCYHLVNYAGCVFELGEADAAVRAARRAVSETERLELPAVLVLARYCLGTILVRLGHTDEGRALLEEVRARGGDESLRALAIASLAEAAVHDGLFDQALAEAARAEELLPDGSEWQAMTRACAARAHLGLHQVELAEAAIGPAIAGMRQTDGFEVGESLVRLIQVEVLEAAGKPDEARAALQTAVARLAERAARIQEPWRRGFLTAVAEHARTLRLAVNLGLELPPVLRDALP